MSDIGTRVYEQIWAELVQATRDFVHGIGFEEVVIGLSGGLDSAAVAVLAVDAFGADKVHLIGMPSKFSSDGTRNDAAILAVNLGCPYDVLPITASCNAVFDTLNEILAPAPEAARELALENIQARMRMIYLMALSNAYGWIVLNTGNKSERFVGYSTLYGDTCGAFAPFGSLYKTELIELLRWRNGLDGAVPQSIFDRPPSAELRDDQKDSDSLPPYPQLDAILELYVDDGLAPADIVASGHDEAAVSRTVKLVEGSAYKRAQEPPAPAISLKDVLPEI